MRMYFKLEVALSEKLPLVKFYIMLELRGPSKFFSEVFQIRFALSEKLIQVRGGISERCCK